jgi:hypothetical protein
MLLACLSSCIAVSQYLPLHDQRNTIMPVLTVTLPQPLLLAVQLISPCKCKGTLKYVHQGCLHKWQDNVARMGGKRDERATVCGVCRSRYTSLPPKAALHVWRKVRSELAMWQDSCCEQQVGFAAIAVLHSAAGKCSCIAACMPIV